MRNKPFVAIPADIRQFETYTWHASPDTYLKAALHVAGVIPLIIPAMASAMDIASILEKVDGVITTGSATNVHPSRYGVDESESHMPFDHDRDELSTALITGAIERHMPLLAICRGHQELNVALGGSLACEIQTLPGRMDHRPPNLPTQEERFGLRHYVQLTPGGKLQQILGAEQIEVNSLHRQAVDRLADRLMVEAQAADGTIEAVSVRDYNQFGFGFQWHPEYLAGKDAPSTAIIEAFGQACSTYAALGRNLHLQGAAE
ncbi:gamma-glutamyl-gamma-aminobutyrate hydrolase family protein [Aureimonas fodinaquatilis]|uniref:gamma-glutamyl-gamma-aminobutyrate hydrolase family protein n=1 Tax=Aureimonas fodinaquatilis TaxID=2565783 RepID=UPI00165D4CFB|nr:gamma-glutamyl-gamma-aminobutyrate hydrolase family protein [Aureimonas fodinaquatilis]